MKLSTNNTRHLKALLKKNWIIYRRSWVVTLFEILIPVAFAALTLMFRTLSPSKDIPQTSYYDNPKTNILFDGQIHSTLMKDCHDDENGGYIALAPPGDDIVNKLDSMFRKLES